MDPVNRHHRPELMALAVRYAIAADRRDPDGFAGVFENDGVLRLAVSPDPGRAPLASRGHAELAKVTRSLARYDKTMHFVGTAGHSLGDHDATGEVYCIAHHISTADGERWDHVMFIRYEDTYRRGDDGEWKIADRVVNLDWTERHPVEADR